MIEIVRDVSFWQLRGALFVQIGGTVVIFANIGGNRSWGLELFTPCRWFALRPFYRLTWRRGE